MKLSEYAIKFGNKYAEIHKAGVMGEIVYTGNLMDAATVLGPDKHAVGFWSFKKERYVLYLKEDEDVSKG